MRIPEAAKNWIIVTVLGAISGWIIGIVKRQSALKNGMKALLQYQIRQACKLHMEAKCISVDDLQDLVDMKDSYKALGGNGAIDKVFNDVYKLPSFEK